MTRLRWQLRVVFASLGREGSIGLGVLGISLFAYLFVVIPTEARQVQLQKDVAALASHVQTAPTPANTASDQLLAFYRFFPPQTSAPDWLDKIFNAARQQHLELVQGKYRARRERAGPLIRYQITLPISGSYSQLHRFLAVVLTEVPNAALDGVTFERRKIGDALVEAKIQISLYLDQQT